MADYLAVLVVVGQVEAADAQRVHVWWHVLTVVGGGARPPNNLAALVSVYPSELVHVRVLVDHDHQPESTRGRQFIRSYSTAFSSRASGAICRSSHVSRDAAKLSANAPRPRAIGWSVTK